MTPTPDGIPLEDSVRAMMESRFDWDFAKVRIHQSNVTIDSSQLLAARAYTAGVHIFFDSGEYAPDSASGLRLLAHELAHVVQQQKATSILQSCGHPGDVWEREANRVASIVSAGGRAKVKAWAHVPGVQCHEHLQLRFPRLKTPERRRPSLMPPGALNLRPPDPFRLTLPRLNIPRPGPPALMLPSEMTLHLPPVMDTVPRMHFTVPTQGRVGFTFDELEALARRRPINLRYMPMGPQSLHLDPILFDLLLNPSRLQKPGPAPPKDYLAMRDRMTMDSGGDVAVSDKIAFELWVAMVLQADASSLKKGRFGLDLFHQPTGTLTLGLPLARGGNSYLAARA